MLQDQVLTTGIQGGIKMRIGFQCSHHRLHNKRQQGQLNPLVLGLLAQGLAQGL